MTTNRLQTLGTRGAVAVVLVVLALVPVVCTTFFTSQVGLTSLWLGIVAVSLTFLSGYGGMVSLAQTALFGVAGLVAAKLSVDAGWNPWAAAPRIHAGADVRIGEFLLIPRQVPATCAEEPELEPAACRAACGG